jgi:hypothetical protein
MSDAGLAFLKCAFASPDFQVDPGKGIPDRYSGRTLAIKDSFTAAPALPAGRDTYFLIAPIPGYAYFSVSVPIGAPLTGLSMDGTIYPTYNTNFGANTQAIGEAPIMSIENFTAFRYASLAAGFYPTSNLMQFAGSIQIWKGNVTFKTKLGQVLRNTVPGAIPVVPSETNNAMFQQINLASLVPSPPRDNYTESFIKGGYTVAFDQTADFEWQDFSFAQRYQDLDGLNTVLQLIPPNFSVPLTGLGNVESIIIKVQTPVGATNAGILRVWNCIEMQVNTQSSLYQFSNTSPPLDAVALDYYSNVRNELPVAVPCAQNETFWLRVLQLLRGMANMAAYIPGPVGLIGQGFSGLLNV